MITLEKLNNLYNGVIKQNKLTNNELNSYGIDSNDLKELIKQGKIELVGNDNYSFKAVDELFCYGKKLISLKQYDMATECFHRCYQLNPNHIDTCLQLFLRSINEKDYKETFKYFEGLPNNNDSNLYLYLLSMITDVPDRYKEYVKNIWYDNMKININDRTYKNIKEHNSIRMAISQKKFLYALKQLNDLVITRGMLQVQDIITKSLLIQVIEKEEKSKNILIQFIQDKSYQKIINHIEEKQRKRDLGLIDLYTLKLSCKILNIYEIGQIPEITVFKTEKLFEAIDGNNFKLALRLIENYNQNNCINNDKSVIYLLLLDIVNYIDKDLTLDNMVGENMNFEKNVDILDSNRKFVKDKYELLLSSQGVILLKPMDKERIDKIHKIVSEYSDMVSFSIGSGDNQQVVLRYKPFISSRLTIKECINKGKIAYKEGNYDLCIDSYLKVLCYGEPKAYVYSMLGLAYMKKMQKDIAIDYLTIATELSKNEGGYYDFTDLIASLRGFVDIEDKKPRFKMVEDEFNNDIENYYGIENIDEITSYILNSSLDVESACYELGMTSEQIDIVRLIYAREFYSQGNDIKGEEFLKAVETSKNKTKFIIKLLDEVRRNKKFYSNRVSEKKQDLVLTLKPKRSR